MIISLLFSFIHTAYASLSLLSFSLHRMSTSIKDKHFFFFFFVVILVVPANRERQQANEALRVLRQLKGVPVQSHLVQVGSDVVAGVTFAECLVRYC